MFLRVTTKTIIYYNNFDHVIAACSFLFKTIYQPNSSCYSYGLMVWWSRNIYEIVINNLKLY